MTTLILASGNQGKLREFSRMLAPLDIRVKPQSDFDITEAEENGLSFVENALIKARHCARLTGLPTLADDSGLEVDALRGAPGIYSSRFAGINASDNENIAALLSALEGVAEAERSARFQCLLVYLRHAEDPTPLICQGTWEGRILFTASGGGGFGYDPIFQVTETGCSAAELSAEQKQAISHRGIAMRRFIEEFSYAKPLS